jgi:hypothetical protein
MPDREIPERKAVKAALRQTGMSARQVDALLRDGWKCLVGETQAENQELRERLAELRQKMS